ncbi:MAG: sporulation transcriptional regulator SpoIIID [Clostridiales bacterium]|nr:sporulation transcriptional regulator SpoIIID [Clostridiales bacterium]
MSEIVDRLCENEIEDRCERLAKYLLVNQATVRDAAKYFGISKSTVHKDVTSRLKEINNTLYEETRELLDKNKSERHLRGGEATKLKYKSNANGQ